MKLYSVLAAAASTTLVGLCTSAQADVLYVTSYLNNNLYTVNSSGTATVFASGFDLPWGITQDSTGNFYVGNSHLATSQITKITPSGVTSTFSTDAGYTHDLVFNSAGKLYTDDGYGHTNWIDGSGVAKSYIVHVSHGLAVDPSGMLYNYDLINSNIQKLNPTTGTESQFALLSGVQSLLWYNSYLYAGMQNGTVDRIDGSGNASLYADTGSNSAIYGMAFDSAGNLFATQPYMNRIEMITSGGSVSTYSTGVAQPYGIVTAVPEPTSLGLLSLGSLVLLKRRHQKKA